MHLDQICPWRQVVTAAESATGLPRSPMIEAGGKPDCGIQAIGCDDPRGRDEPVQIVHTLTPKQTDAEFAGAADQELVQPASPQRQPERRVERGFDHDSAIDKPDAAKSISLSARIDVQPAQRLDTLRKNALSACFVDGRIRTFGDGNFESLQAGGNCR